MPYSNYSYAAPLPPPSQPAMIYFFGYLILTARWLSRYENDLLLGLCPALFYKVSALLLVS